MFKAGETITNFILEDFAQVGLQYFYFEKYRFRESILIEVITSFMEFKRFCYDRKSYKLFQVEVLCPDIK